MCLNNKERTLITTLKGRISKILGVTTRLSNNERNGLINIYNIIDKFLIGKEFETVEKFKLSLEQCSSISLENSNKKYIKENILPLIHSIKSGDSRNE